MPERKKTPDIMGALLGGSTPVHQQDSIPAEQQTVIPESQNTIKTVNRNSGIPAEQQDGEPVQQNTGTPESHNTGKLVSRKVKVTYYVDEATAEALDDIQSLLRKMAGRRKATSISRSDIVEKALQVALADLQSNKRQSWIARALLDEQEG